MKQKLFVLFAAALLLTACNNEKIQDEEKDSQKEESKDSTVAEMSGPPDSAQQAEMMKKWQDFMTPGDMHKEMAKQVGTWEGEVSQWMDPSAPPTKAMAKSVTTSAMNGLYLMDDYTSTMMGQPMMGHAIMGYDKMRNLFVSSWIDNLGSGIVQMEGTYDEATKTLNMKGRQSDPGMGKQTDIRQEQKWIDNDTYVMAMYGTGHDGKTEQKFMEGTFKRVKK